MGTRQLIRSGEQPVIAYSWGKQSWQPWSSAEQLATRQRVAVFDQTSFAKYLVAGPDADAALQWLCTNDVAVPPGRTVYTGMLNSRGTYESDLTVTRLPATEFLLVASAAAAERDADHIRRQLPGGCQASLTDVTSSSAGSCMCRPSSPSACKATSWPPGRTSVSPTPATTRSSRSGWRRPIAPSAGS
ncbi:MAG: hypothetical protein ACRDOK_07110 [Streptosporangiaceae bacterium]